MLIQYNQPKFVERIFVSKDGRQFKVVFLVAVVNGELKGQIVSVQLLSKALTGECSQNSIPCLPISSPSNKSKSEYVPYYAPFVSPFSELLFFTSQPTRAPSFV